MGRRAGRSPERELADWLRMLASANGIVELGAGKAIPRVRIRTEHTPPSQLPVVGVAAAR